MPTTDVATESRAALRVDPVVALCLTAAIVADDGAVVALSYAFRRSSVLINSGHDADFTKLIRFFAQSRRYEIGHRDLREFQWLLYSASPEDRQSTLPH